MDVGLEAIYWNKWHLIIKLIKHDPKQLYKAC